MIDNILTIKELSNKLQVSPSWIYKKARCKIIPHFRIGGTIRFSKSEIDNWLQSHHVKGCQKV
jgi:excisionase family DNA binding protein